MPSRHYCVYILTNRYGTLYVGMTNNLERRLYEHKQRLVPGFASRYNVTLLVYYEETNDAWAAIGREKQIKAWRRSKKVALVESATPSGATSVRTGTNGGIPRFARNDNWAGSQCLTLTEPSSTSD